MGDPVWPRHFVLRNPGDFDGPRSLARRRAIREGFDVSVVVVLLSILAAVSETPVYDLALRLAIAGG